MPMLYEFTEGIFAFFSIARINCGLKFATVPSSAEILQSSVIKPGRGRHRWILIVIKNQITL